MPTQKQIKSVIHEFLGLPQGTPLYANIFDDTDPEYNCTLFACNDARITVVYKGVKYTFNECGKIGESVKRNLYLKKPKTARKTKRY